MLLNINETIFRFFNDFALRTEWLDTVFVFGAFFLGWALLLGVILVFGFEIARARGRFAYGAWVRKAVVVFASTALAWGIAELLKMFIGTPRPFEALEGVRQLFPIAPIDSAFPSGHASAFSALAGATLFYHKRFGAFLLLGAFIIGLSRVTVGIHWPLDVLVGFLLGAGVAWGVYRIAKGHHV